MAVLLLKETAFPWLIHQQACNSRIIPPTLLPQAWRLHAHAVHGAGLKQHRVTMIFQPLLTCRASSSEVEPTRRERCRAASALCPARMRR